MVTAWYKILQSFVLLMNFLAYLYNYLYGILAYKRDKNPVFRKNFVLPKNCVIVF